jgi:cation transport regulator
LPRTSAKTKTKTITKTRKKPTSKRRSTSTGLSARTKKQIDSLPEHAQEMYKKAHAKSLEQYQKPQKRRGGKKQSAEQVAHKAAWAAVKKEYVKQGDKWVQKEKEK